MPGQDVGCEGDREGERGGVRVTLRASGFSRHLGRGRGLLRGEVLGGKRIPSGDQWRVLSRAPLTQVTYHLGAVRRVEWGRGQVSTPPGAAGRRGQTCGVSGCPVLKRGERFLCPRTRP